MSQLKVSTWNLSVRLPDGRRLGYSEYGVADGSPVLFFHGAPGSSYIHADLAEIAAQRGVRLIALDRPGYGVSDEQQERSFLSWADDVAALIAALGIARFSIIGFSAGTPYPLACAYSLPNHVRKVALVSALCPVSVPGVIDEMSPMVSGLYELARANPDELRATFAAIAPNAAALLAAMSASAGDFDKQLLDGRSAECLLEYERTLRGGIEGLASDFILNAGDWGFSIADINAEVHLWSGTQDQNTPPAMSQYLATTLGNSYFHRLPEEGHFILYTHWDEILRCLI